MAKTLDDIFADEPGAQARPAPATSLDSIFSDEPPPQARPEPAAPAPRKPAIVEGIKTAGGWLAGQRLPSLDELKHQALMSLRAPVQAGAEFAGMIADPITATGNLVFGRDNKMPSQHYGEILDRTFGKPQGGAEEFANKVATAGFGATGQMGLAAAAKPVTQAGRAAVEALTTNPVGQVAGAASGAGAAELSRQAGMPWWAQFLSSMIAGPVGGATANKVADKTQEFATVRDMVTREGRAFPQIVEQRAQQTAQQAGVNWQDLTEATRNSLRGSVERALRTNQQLDPVMTQRQLQFRALGAEPTNAMLTRNPQDWAAEDRLRGHPGIGRPLDQAHENVGTAVRNELNSRGQPGDTATGRAIGGGLSGVRSDMRTATRSAYNAADQTPEAMSGVPTSDLLAFLNSRQARVPTAPVYRQALDELTALAGGNPSITQRNLEELRNSMNAAHSGGMNRPNDSAISEILRQLDAAIAQRPQTPAYRNARELAKIGRYTFDEQGLVDDLSSMATKTNRKVPFSEVYDKLIKADPESLMQVRNTLEVGGRGQAWEVLKARTMEDLATTLNLAGTTENRGGMFLRRMANLREQLPVIFNPEELARLEAARTVVANAMTAPRGTMKLSNPSGTANAALGHAYDLLRSAGSSGGAVMNRFLGGAPGVARQAWQGMQDRSAVNAAMNPSIVTDGLLARPGSPSGAWLTPGLMGLIYGGGASGQGQ